MEETITETIEDAEQLREEVNSMKTEDKVVGGAVVGLVVAYVGAVAFGFVDFEFGLVEGLLLAALGIAGLDTAADYYERYDEEVEEFVEEHADDLEGAFDDV